MKRILFASAGVLAMIGLIGSAHAADLPRQMVTKAPVYGVAFDATGDEQSTWQLEPSAGPMLPPPGQRVALASDAAFSFVYAHVLSAWRSAGAEIVPFSPLADAAPREDFEPERNGGRPPLRLIGLIKPTAGRCS